MIETMFKKFICAEVCFAIKKQKYIIKFIGLLVLLFQYMKFILKWARYSLCLTNIIALKINMYVYKEKTYVLFYRLLYHDQLL